MWIRSLEQLSKFSLKQCNQYLMPQEKAEDVKLRLFSCFKCLNDIIYRKHLFQEEDDDTELLQHTYWLLQ